MTVLWKYIMTWVKNQCQAKDENYTALAMIQDLLRFLIPVLKSSQENRRNYYTQLYTQQRLIIQPHKRSKHKEGRRNLKTPLTRFLILYCNGRKLSVHIFLCRVYEHGIMYHVDGCWGKHVPRRCLLSGIYQGVHGSRAGETRHYNPGNGGGWIISKYIAWLRKFLNAGSLFCEVKCV